jgi:phosphohistidine phosphatase
VRLFLVRHGESGPGSPDSLRTLTPAGRASVARLAERAARAGVRVEAIRHSGLVRARETAELLAARLRPAHGVEGMSGLAPEDDPEAAAIELGLADAPLLVVTHMPFVAALTGRLLAGGRAAVAPGYGTAELRGFERTDGSWRQVLALSGDG